MTDTPRTITLLAWLVVVALVAACSGGGPQAPRTSEPQAGGTLENYRVGIVDDTTTDSYWAYLDPEATAYNGYLLGYTKSTMFGLTTPINDDIEAGGVVVPVLAEGLPAEPVQSGDVWVVTQPIRKGLVWSDGEEITAHDFVFTVNTVHDFNLSANWAGLYPKVDPGDPASSGIVGVEAVDDYTVRITFNREPGLRLWPHAVGVGPWMPEHFWADVVEGARATEDPAATLYAASGAGEPSGGPLVFESREPGAFSRVVANERYYDQGAGTRLYESGAVASLSPEGEEEEVFGDKGNGEIALEYRGGPFLNSETLTLYGSLDAAVLALRQGEIDYLLDTIPSGLRDQVAQDPDLEAVINPSFSFSYLALNLRKFPMDQKAFRQALAVMIDRELVTETVLQGTATPTYTMMPPGNAKWFNEEVAAEIKERSAAGWTRSQRVTEAVRLLREGGFSWAAEPSVDTQSGAVTAGTGLVGPAGQPLPPLALLVPPPSGGPVGAAFGTAIEQAARELGVPLSVNTTPFNALTPQIFTAAGQPPPFDMALLAWQLGNPAFPGFYEGFWHSRHDAATSGGFNAPGFANAEFDRLADAYQATRSEDDAFDLMWEMERILAEERPYIVVTSSPVVEAYRPGSVRYPFTDQLGGIEYLAGMPSLVSAPQ
ncbi:MAG: ABC transporter substrate-binding protein [Egibacteraceae bacterium]